MNLTHEQVELLFYTLESGLHMQGGLDPEVFQKTVPEIRKLIADLAICFSAKGVGIELDLPLSDEVVERFRELTK